MPNGVASRSTQTAAQPDLRAWLRLAFKLLFFALFCVLVFGYFFGFIRITSIAMTPDLRDGDLAFFIRHQSYTIDDKIIYTQDGKTNVSAIIATAGQVITVDSDGYLVVNQDKLDLGPIFTADSPKSSFSQPYRVPSDSVFILNNNLNDPHDSRTFGALPVQQIKGKIISILRTREI